eukprot:TRINITY_DN637_c0_g3_i1.p1 TRINITY_DN637_c0_g3~~TRINITY_DN637_c0_g3_i1.p1  ORF type:complete len:397 (+),score=43.69 TRINITY_DN637_c0_g3_i1:129-1193(+)
MYKAIPNDYTKQLVTAPRFSNVVLNQPGEPYTIWHVTGPLIFNINPSSCESAAFFPKYLTTTKEKTANSSKWRMAEPDEVLVLLPGAVNGTYNETRLKKYSWSDANIATYFELSSRSVTYYARWNNFWGLGIIVSRICTHPITQNTPSFINDTIPILSDWNEEYLSTVYKVNDTDNPVATQFASFRLSNGQVTMCYGSANADPLLMIPEYSVLIPSVRCPYYVQNHTRYEYSTISSVINNVRKENQQKQDELVWWYYAFQSKCVDAFENTLSVGVKMGGKTIIDSVAFSLSMMSAVIYVVTLVMGVVVTKFVDNNNDLDKVLYKMREGEVEIESGVKYNNFDQSINQSINPIQC